MTDKHIATMLKGLFRSLGFEYLGIHIVMVRGESAIMLDFKKGEEEISVAFQTDTTIGEEA